MSINCSCKKSPDYKRDLKKKESYKMEGLNKQPNPETTTTTNTEGTSQETGATQTSTTTTNGANAPEVKEELFKKIDEIIEKRTGGLLRSVLKDFGLSDEDMQKAVSNYKQSKKEKEATTEQNIRELEKKNEELMAQIKEGARASAIAKVAAELGLNGKAASYVEKLSDFSSIEKDGKFDEEEIKKAMSTVLEDIPAFKTEATNSGSGFVAIGSKQSEPKEESAINRIRKLAGLPEIKK